MRIHALNTGRVKIKASQLVGRGHGLARQLRPLVDPEWSAWLPTYAWAIEHSEGVILVDTGATTALQKLPRWHPFFRFALEFDIEPAQEVLPQLRGLGINAADVKKIFMTHLHFDHDAGLAFFPSSEVYARPGEVARASGLAGRVRGYLPERWPKTFDPQPLEFLDVPYGPFARSSRLTRRGDVVAVPTPGHTPDHMSIIVEDGDIAIFLAGDVSYNEKNMIDGRLDGISPNEGVTMDTLDLVRRFAESRPTIFLPTHDPAAATRLAERQTVVLGRKNL
jgi:glyoxylase-like metal-dependent hydrolase (beta-lactamase superfamily II)